MALVLQENDPDICQLPPFCHLWSGTQIESIVQPAFVPYVVPCSQLSGLSSQDFLFSLLMTFLFLVEHCDNVLQYV